MHYLKYPSINKMVFIKLLFVLVTIIFLYPANSANAKCTFDELKLGDDISRVGDNRMIDDMDPEQVVVYMSIKDACPNENLGFSSVEIAFIENKLVSFKILVGLDNRNTETNKKLLYEYVEKEYGKIDPDNNPDWLGFKVWRNGQETVVYKKMYGVTKIFIEETLYITSKEYRDELLERNSED